MYCIRNVWQEIIKELTGITDISKWTKNKIKAELNNALKEMGFGDVNKILEIGQNLYKPIKNILASANKSDALVKEAKDYLNKKLNEFFFPDTGKKNPDIDAAIKELKDALDKLQSTAEKYVKIYGN